MATIFIFDLIITIDKNLYVIYNVFYNKGVFIMSNENQKDNKENFLTKFLKAIHEYYIFSFIFLFSLSIIIFAIIYICHSKNIENRFNNTLQNYEKSMSAIFNNMVITNGNNESINTNSFQTNSIENLKLSFEVGFKMLESSMNEIMKNSNDILQFWFAFLSVIMIVFTLIGFFLNNNILNQAREQLKMIEKEAKNETDKLIQESSRKIQENNLFNLGFQAYNNKDYKTSEYYFTKVIELNLKNSGAYHNRGLSKHYLKDYDGAIKDYNEAIRLNPSISETYNNRGAVKYDLANTKEKNSEEYNKLIKEAIEDYNEAIRLNSNYSTAFYNRGLAKLQLGKIEEAIKDFIKAYESNNNNEAKENSKNQLINLAKQGYEEAIKFCEEHNIDYKK